ncbi:sigma-54 dependent transcriptional regulator [Clostridium estertheticum]|uniref:sigma-54-dependent transcriptional regulator n=1 Tax=Clostridium estertheticum TaxID=238834 RepID=UPI0013E969A9|nr:sigma-54 dependent transcriptional regulator [Clostridium estertheticum]MBZ9687708.1 sigma-54 dependent transcriptional regulator [Clostridium estertheticum]
MTKYSILIVDDEENVRKLLQKIFLKENYITHIASNAEEALHIIDTFQVDVVITDIKMPGMSGIELLNKIREIDISIQVIMITAFATLETAIDALKMGAKDYITKPFNLEDILLSVKKLINSIDSTDILDSHSKNSVNNINNSLSSDSISMRKVIDIIAHVADTKSTVMIYGETGTGKELAAHSLHFLSSRKDKPFIKVNCAAIPDSLLDSELFGYDKGAFTGAVVKKPGRFELANGGSIFLDEIGDISANVQVKLLRVLQEREIEHLGGTKTIKIDVRIIAATNRNLEDLVKKQIFREDLYYRLNVVPINLPPLRERKEDILKLANSFLSKASIISGREKKQITEAALKYLINYNWPGNIRELENIIERCVVVTSKEIITQEDLPSYITNYNPTKPIEKQCESLDSVIDNAEKEVLIKALKQCNGNRTKASELLGISRRSLHRKIIKYSIED